jgi:hypothetical protein
MIKKVAGGYRVISENGKKNLGGPYKTKKEAESGYGKWNSLSIKRARPACPVLGRFP